MAQTPVALMAVVVGSALVLATEQVAAVNAFFPPDLKCLMGKHCSTSEKEGRPLDGNCTEWML